MKNNIKLLGQGLAAVLVGYALLMAIFQFCVYFEKSVSTGYMQSNCERLSDSKGHQWYECDIK